MVNAIVSVLIAFVVLSAGSPADAAATDHRRPTVGFTTADGAVMVAAPAESDLSATTGWAKDDLSGVRRVFVTYCPGTKSDDGSWTCGSTGSVGSVTLVRAALACSATRRSCTWSASVPPEPGTYLVFVKATDRAGHGRAAGPIEVYVA